MQQDIRREAWSAPASRKIAPGQAKKQTGCVARKKLPENIHKRSKHSSMSATGLPRAGELPTPAGLADVGKAPPHVITRHLHAVHKHSTQAAQRTAVNPGKDCMYKGSKVVYACS
jgi:hypothetical protein